MFGCGIDIYQTFKDFPAPLATMLAAFIAAGITGYFARHQYKVAKEKLRLDLFDRRFAVYESIFKFYNALDAWNNLSEQERTTAKESFFKAKYTSKFLFASDSKIEDILRSMYDDGSIVIHYKERILTDGSNEAREKINSIMFGTFEVNLKKVTEAISKYITFQKI